MHIGDQWMQLHSRDKALDETFDRPFPVGVEYYRPPVPPPEYWDEDFRRISAAGMSIVRVWYSWDWVETLPHHYEFDDLDRLFDLAAQHGLKVWVDTPLGTHMACPAWMLRSHPDMRVVRRDGSVQQNTTGAFAAHGAMTQCGGSMSSAICASFVGGLHSTEKKTLGQSPFAAALGRADR